MKWHENVRDLYDRGLTAKEIGLNVLRSEKSVQEFINSEGFRLSYDEKYNLALKFISRYINLDVLYSVSCFKIHRQQRGVIVEFIRGVTGMHFTTIASKVGYTGDKYARDCSYAREVAPELIANFVKLYYDTRRGKKIIEVPEADRAAAKGSEYGGSSAEKKGDDLRQ